MVDKPPEAPTDHEEELLARLRELTRERDPVPEHVTAAARSALAARRRAIAGAPTRTGGWSMKGRDS